MSGGTTSSNFPVIGNAFQSTYGGGEKDGFITIYDLNEQQITYSSYIGGSHDDGISTIISDSESNILITGYTSSSNFPTSTNAYQTTLAGGEDAFVLKFNAGSLTMNFSTLLGGSTEDKGRGIALDSNGNLFLIGLTNSIDFPITTNAFQASKGYTFDAFVSIFDLLGQKLLYSTFLGGNNGDYGKLILFDNADNLLIAGTTDSSDFNVLNAIQESEAGEYDSFICKFEVIVSTPSQKSSFPSVICFALLLGTYLVFYVRRKWNGPKK